MADMKFYALYVLGSFLIGLFPCSCDGQEAIDRYLSTHKYPIHVSDDGSAALEALFKEKLSGNKVLFLGEGGSHQLEFYEPLKLYFLRLLNRSMGVRSLVMEYGSSIALLYNAYIRTGDTSYLPPFRNKNHLHFLQALRDYNQLEGKKNPIQTVGIDFERSPYYSRALQSILPDQPVPQELQKEVNIIKTASDSMDCDGLIAIDRLLKRSLLQKRAVWKQYCGNRFNDFANIISNEGTCRDVYKNRNYHLKERLEWFDSLLADSLYYCELGQAHVNFALKNASWLLDNDKKSPFYKKVSVINVYCYNCTSPEGVSNWALRRVENDIREIFLKQCDLDFTLFDLTGADPSIVKYKKFGQFLLVVKNQK